MSRLWNRLRRCALPALLAAAVCAPAHAQDAGGATTTTTTTTTPTVTTTTTTTTTVMPAPMDGGMMSGPMDMNGADYRLLSNPAYDYIDLKMAQALGYSPSEIASISKISRLTGLPFRFVLSRVHAGRTFALLASDYNLRLGDVLDSSDEQARIARYLSLYESLDLLGTAHTPPIMAAQEVSGDSLAVLEARYAQLNAAFPALPPTNIETSQIGSDQTTVTQVVAPPPPPPPAPIVPEAPPAQVMPTAMPMPHAARHVRSRHHARHHRVRHHRHAPYLTRMGS